MQYTPPQSPDPHCNQINLGHGNPHSQFPKDPIASIPVKYNPQEDNFAKRPISPPLSSGENSDSQHIKESHPVSLLSALMHSPHPTSSGTGTGTGSGMLSPHSSVPSTAVSSPHLRPVSSSASHSHGTQGGLDVPAMSILRRDSVSSDGEVLHVPQVQALAEVRPDIVKRASSLKFAVAPPLKRRSSVNPNSNTNPHTHTPDQPVAPKFDTPPPEVDESVEMEEDVDVIEEDTNEEDINEEEIEDGSEESDLGYQEDSESSDEDADSPRYRYPIGKEKKYPFARSTNYRRRRLNPTERERALSPSPPPAPAVLPPPTRRGRGHIRVDESCISGKETEGHCSRHRSPPPSRSRSHSRTRNGNGNGIGMGEGRLSDAGPRDGRAGSPMPSRSKILAPSDDEDEDENNGESPVDKKDVDVFGNWGWRSDDAAFKGGMVKGIRTVSAPSYAVTDDDDYHNRKLAAPNGNGNGTDTGMRSFIRRASEHIPIPSIPFRRPEPYAQPHPHPHHQRSPSTTGRALSPSGSPCPPALDETPVLASSMARVEKDYSGGLAHRLEQSLSTDHARAESGRE